VNKLFKSLLVSFLVATLSHVARAADASYLKPPSGAKVAVVMFEDLECPTCANAYPVVWEAANAHKVPVVLHDFPLPKHPWAFDAAVYARFFDTKSQQLGNDFRGFIYKNQINITAQNLRQFVQKFADDNKIPLPFTVDPGGTLKAKIQVDYALGQQVGLQHTPTIFVIGAGGPSTPFVEVTDLAQLGQIIEDMQRKAGAATAPVQQRARKVRR
jgi:protein-disulfide isomerase